MSIALRRPSNADLLALHRAGRGKILAMVAVVVMALAAAAASFLIEPDAQGNPDDPTRILVVTQGQPSGYGARLREWGFEAAEGSFVTWTQKARDELERPPASDVMALLELADEFGYGYVAFEHPQRVEFEAAEIEDLPEDFSPGTRFAVVSVGDLGNPARLTVHPRPPPSVRDSSLLLLEALFEQPELAGLEETAGAGGLSKLELRDRLHAGLDQLLRLPKAVALAEDTRAAVQRIVEQANPRAPPVIPLGFATELSVALPLADGSTLLAGRGYSLVSHDAVRVHVDFDEHEYVRVVGDQETLANGRLCPEPTGPVVPVGDLPRITVAADGRAVGVDTPAGRLQVWRLQSEGDCRLQGLGTFDPPSLDGLGTPVIGAEHVGWSGRAEGAAVLAVVSLQDRTRSLLGLVDGHQFEQPAWMDPRSLLAIDRSPDGADGVAFFHVDHPLVVPRLDARVFEGAERLASVVHGRDAGGEFLVAVTTDADRMYRANLPSDWRMGFERVPVPEPSAEAGLPAFLPIDTNVVRVEALLHRGAPHSLQVAPGGGWLAFGWVTSKPSSEWRSVVALMDLGEPDSVIQLTDNQWSGFVPRFVPNRDRLVFSTGFIVPNTNTRVVTARSATIPR